jgi:endonuclease G
MAKRRKTTSKKTRNQGKRVAWLLVILLVLWVLTIFFAPSEVPVATQTGGSQIADLELPLIQDPDAVIVHTGYTLEYDETYEQPRWVAYELTRDELYGPVERTDNFRADPAVPQGSATLDDYRGSGYDRGHLIPAADSNWSEQAMEDSFYLSNMSPQSPQFNRGIWSKLESNVRNFADADGAIYVVTGPVLTDGPFETIGESDVAIPKRYYKVLLDYREPTVKAIGFVLPNEGSKEDLQTFATSVDRVEALTGLDFFPRLPDDEETMLEGSYDSDLWSFGEFRATQSERSEYTPTDQPATAQTQDQLYGTFMEILVTVKKESIALLATFVSEDLLERLSPR